MTYDECLARHEICRILLDLTVQSAARLHDIYWLEMNWAMHGPGWGHGDA